MNSIPFLRFAAPCCILYLFYWCFSLNPHVTEDTGDDQSASERVVQELLARSRQLVLAGKLDEAITPTLELHRAYPENHLYIQQLATIYQSLGRHRDESEMWEKFLQYSPQPLEGCPHLGFAYRRQDREKEAISAFERCLALDEQEPDSLFYLAHAVEMEGQYARARDLYQRGLKVSPLYPDHAIGLARTQLRLGQAAEARRGILKVLARRPDNTDALLVAGLVFLSDGELETAAGYLERGLRLSPGYADFRLVLNRVRSEALRRAQTISHHNRHPALPAGG